MQRSLNAGHLRVSLVILFRPSWLSGIKISAFLKKKKKKSGDEAEVAQSPFKMTQQLYIPHKMTELLQRKVLFYFNSIFTTWITKQLNNLLNKYTFKRSNGFINFPPWNREPFGWKMSSIWHQAVKIIDSLKRQLLCQIRILMRFSEQYTTKYMAGILSTGAHLQNYATLIGHSTCKKKECWPLLYAFVLHFNLCCWY